MYVLLTLALCSVLASVSLYHACPWDQSPYDASRATKVRACLEDKWTSTKGNFSRVNQAQHVIVLYVS